MKKNNYLVSIIIRAKNEEKWISACLRSVFNQSNKNIEVIISYIQGDKHNFLKFLYSIQWSPVS